jgi:hypothetical protein
MSARDQISRDVVVGISAVKAGVVTHNQDDGTYLVLNQCFQAWDGYEGTRGHLAPNDGESIILECEDYDMNAACKILERLRPEWSFYEGMNDTWEGGYVVAVTEKKVIVPLPGVDFDALMEIAADELYLETTGSDCENVIVVDFQSNPDLAGWQCIADDQ